jgi:hypothetical protein
MAGQRPANDGTGKVPRHLNNYNWFLMRPFPLVISVVFIIPTLAG